MPSFCDSWFNVVLTLSVVLVGVYFVQNDVHVKPEPYELPPPPKLQGVLAVNTKLRNAQYLLFGQVKGPESLHVEGDVIYTGTWDAKVLKIRNGVIEKEFRLQEPPQNVKCDASFDSEPQCGRPLGFRRFDKHHFLFADAYLGLFLLNTETAKSQRILAPELTAIDGRSACTFFNDVEVVDEDAVIFSCSSTKWQRRHAFQTLFDQTSDAGIFKFQLSSKKLQVLADGFRFTNGVQLSHDKKTLFFSETGMARIWSLSLIDPKSKPNIFIENLPGLPDNIRETPKGTYLVGLASHRSDGKLSLFDKLGPLDWVRKFFIQVLPNAAFTYLPHFMPKYGHVVEFNEQGEVVASYQDPSGQAVNYISEAVEADGFLYLGSFKDSYIAKVPKKGH